MEDEKTTELFIFVKELMQLSPELELEYNYFITKQKNVEEMRVASQSMLDLVNLLSAEFYGQTIEDKEAQLQESKVELQDKKLIIARSIINLRDKMNLNAAQIADLLDLEIPFVESVLNSVND